VVRLHQEYRIRRQVHSQIEEALRRNQGDHLRHVRRIAMLMLLARVWLAILFASRLTQPIGALMARRSACAVDDLSARAEEGRQTDELGLLARSFNRMTSPVEEPAARAG
jgi:two-component system nitrogen regulation sensor histidine kinase NtrY